MDKIFIAESIACNTNPKTLYVKMTKIVFEYNLKCTFPYVRRKLEESSLFIPYL